MLNNDLEISTINILIADMIITKMHLIYIMHASLQCLDTVGWVPERASKVPVKT